MTINYINYTSIPFNTGPFSARQNNIVVMIRAEKYAVNENTEFLCTLMPIDYCY